MLKLSTLIILFFSLTSTTTGDTCSCYCSSSSYYLGDVNTISCSSSSCQSDCYTAYSTTYYSSYYQCTWSNTYGTCWGSVYGTASYGVVWHVGTIIGVAVGCLAGLALLVTIIVVTIICCKRKRAQLWAIQPQLQQQQMGQMGFVSGQQQQWPPGIHYPAPGGSMNNMYPQHPPTYFSPQQAKVQV